MIQIIASFGLASRQPWLLNHKVKLLPCYSIVDPLPQTEWVVKLFYSIINNSIEQEVRCQIIQIISNPNFVAQILSTEMAQKSSADYMTQSYNDKCIAWDLLSLLE